MGVYDFLTSAFNDFIAAFPPQLQWVVALLVLVGLIVLLIQLIQHHILFIVVLIVLLPFLIPAFASVARELYEFILYLVGFLKQTG